MLVALLRNANVMVFIWRFRHHLLLVLACHSKLFLNATKSGFTTFHLDKLFDEVSLICSFVSGLRPSMLELALRKIIRQ